MRFSHSRVSTFVQCPYKFKLRYLNGMETIQDPAADNALVIGKAMHMGIEEGMPAAVQWYAEQFSILIDLHIHEIIKLEILLPKVRALIDYDASIFELEVKTEDFVGYIDLIVKKENGSVDVFDFKYSNNIDRYQESEQLHLYKHYLEKVHGLTVDRMGYIFIPKTSIRQKKSEDLYQFRRRLLQTLHELKVTVTEVVYDPQKVERFFQHIECIHEASDYPKHPTKLCDW